MSHVVQSIHESKVDAVLSLVIQLSEGPREAFGIIATVLKTLNEEIIDEDARVTTEVLCQELCISINSIRKVQGSVQ